MAKRKNHQVEYAESLADDDTCFRVQITMPDGKRLHAMLLAPDRDTAHVPTIGWNVSLPELFQVGFQGSAVPFGMKLEIRVDAGVTVVNALLVHSLHRDGRYVSTPRMAKSVVHRPQTEVRRIDSNGLRAIHVPMLLRVATLVAVFHFRHGSEPSLDVGIEELERMLSVERQRHAPRSYGDDHYQDVADIYRRAHANSQNPTEFVALEKKVSRPTAGRFVREARRRGFLGPTRPGRAGELERED